HFLVEYKLSDASTWDSDTTSDESYELTGLTENTSYLWRVQSICAGDDSPVTGVSFVTEHEIGCASATGLLADMISDTSARLTWAEDTTASRYDIRYRRAGTSYWYHALSFSDSLMLTTGLLPGTEYAWQVRVLCDSSQSYGVFVQGPAFVTTGARVCYPPSDMITSNFTDSSVTFSWSEVPEATQYTLRYRLKETISWNNAIDSMTLVHADSITIPADVGTFFTLFSGGSSFNYTGGGIYVAWEYTNDSLPLSTPNTALCHMQIGPILSFSARTDGSNTEHKEILDAADLRPETWFGTNSIKDSVEIESIYAMGQNAIPFGNPTLIQARINNFSSAAHTYPVTLTVKNQLTQAVRYTASQNVSVSGDSSAVATFIGWSPENYETDSILISIPAQGDEDELSNNSNYYLQVVSPNWISYADNANQLESASAGHGSSEGLLVNRHMMQGCGTVIGIKVHLDYSAIGHTVYAVVLDSTGTVVAQSYHLIPDTTDVNRYYAFHLTTTPSFTNEYYYIGLAQTSGSGAYHPVGVQWEGVHIRSDAYYRASLDGSGLTDALANGRLMIVGEIIPAMPAPYIYGDEILCSGTSGTLETGSRQLRYANEVIDFSSQFLDYAFSAARTLGVPNIAPDGSLSPEVWLSETPDDQREYLILGFPDPAPINNIQIHESLNPGAVDTVYVKNPVTEHFDVVWSIAPDTAAATGEISRIFNIEFDMTVFSVSEIRIAIASDSVAGFNAIDAVAIGQHYEQATYDSYLWSPGGQITSTITITEDGNYGLEVEAGVCTASTSLEVVTSNLIAPTITVGGPTTFCEGGSVVLLSSKAGGNIWSTGATTDSIIVSASGFYTVSRDDGCDTLYSDSVEVIVNPLPDVSVTGTVICQGDTATLDAGAGFTQYVWSTGDSTQTIPATTIALYFVTVTDTNGCVGDTFVITSLRIPPFPQISGDLGFCPGDSTILDAGNGFAQYLWSTSATTQSIAVTTPGIIDVIVTDDDGCTGVDAVTINAYVAPTPFISGSLGICLGNSTELDAGNGYSAYEWSTGETSQTVFVDTVTTITVTVTDIGGCTGSTSVTTTLDGSIPDAPGPISGQETGLCDQSGIVYTIDPVPNAEFYVWTVPTGVTIDSGQGSTSITVTTDFAFSNGDIVVAASNACGQSPSIYPTYLSIQGYPDSPGPISGTTFIECNYANIKYAVSPVGEATSYNWTVPAGAVIISGQGTNDISITFGGVSGDICVTADNSCSSSPSSCTSVEITEANNLYVTSAMDIGSGTLRQLVLDACWGDTIRIDPSLIGDTINLTGVEIDINKHLSIIGPGKELLHVSGENNSRIFYIQPGSFTYLKGFTIINGYSLLDGGAFFNEGIVTLSDMRFKNNYQGVALKAFSNDEKVLIKPGLVEVLQ
ncbi:MAG: hypothetical protein DRI69_09955, partial [Bacteroidetes bacterium]